MGLLATVSLSLLTMEQDVPFSYTECFMMRQASTEPLWVVYHVDTAVLLES